MVCRQLVSALEENLIVEDIRLYPYFTTDKIIDQHLLATVNLKAYHILVTVGNQPLYLFLRQRQRVAHLTAGVAVILEILNLRAFRFQLFGGIESNISLVGIQ